MAYKVPVVKLHFPDLSKFPEFSAPFEHLIRKRGEVKNEVKTTIS